MNLYAFYSKHFLCSSETFSCLFEMFLGSGGRVLGSRRVCVTYVKKVLVLFNDMYVYIVRGRKAGKK